jgi:FkbM family methyltransferase
MAERGLVRRFLTRPAVERVVATGLRSSAVRERGRFVFRELTGRRGVSRYRLRGSPFVAFLRHGTPDVATLDDVFYSRHYEPPEPVARLLGSLGRPPEVLDLGANVGLFGLWALERFPGARVISFEPDPGNAELLRRCAEANDGSWELVAAAAWTSDGSVPFAAGGFSVSRIEPASGKRVPAADVLPRLARADLAKVDIEGSEWAILGDERFQHSLPRTLVLEYHSHMCPEASPRDAAERILRGVGLELESGQTFGRDHGIVWAWRP